MENKEILNNLENILKLSEYNLGKNSFTIGENAGIKYLEGVKEEVEETLEEYRENNKVYLEDEFGDILWDWLQAVKIAERDGMIDSLENVVKHSLEKYSQRLKILEESNYLKKVAKEGLDNVSALWVGVKNRQKEVLKKRHDQLYKK